MFRIYFTLWHVYCEIKLVLIDLLTNMQDRRLCCLSSRTRPGHHPPAHGKGADVVRGNISGWRRMIVINAEVRVEERAQQSNVVFVCRPVIYAESAEWRWTVSEPPRSLCHAFTSRNISLLSNEHKSVTSLINRIRAHRQSPLFYRHPLTCNCQAAAWSVQIPPKMFALFRRVSHLRFTSRCFICLAIFWNHLLYKL